MTIHRNPVDGARIPYPLACIDIDPATGLRVGPEPKCWTLQQNHPVSQKRPYFHCPNIGSKEPGRCDTHTFLYPRRWTKGGEYYHVHQGIDIFAAKGTPIRSVTAGKVHAASKVFLKGYGGYGMVVVIRTPDLFGETHYFLYAHCMDVFVREDDDVSEQQIIATVGTTYFPEEGSNACFKDSEATFTSRSRLWSTRPCPSGRWASRSSGVGVSTPTRSSRSSARGA